MNLQTWVSLAEIISAFAVTLTLIAVIVSVRQNTRSQKALAVESLAPAITAINLPGMESPALGAALAKTTADWSSASREERMIAHFFLFSFFKLLENAWYQKKAGILDQAQWVRWETMLRRYYHGPGVQQAWCARAQECLFAGISEIPLRNKTARRTQQFERIVRLARSYSNKVTGDRVKLCHAANGSDK